MAVVEHRLQKCLDPLDGSNLFEELIKILKTVKTYLV